MSKATMKLNGLIYQNKLQRTKNKVTMKIKNSGLIGILKLKRKIEKTNQIH